MEEGISLEKLNLRTPKKFDYTDEAGTIKPRVRFYCVSEGATEESYFFGVRNNKVASEDKWKENCKWENFDAEIDKVCVIFDRDYRNLETFLEEIFNLCDKHKIKVVMSNPNFELWVLMHFPNIKQYPNKMLLENKKNLRYQLFENVSTNKKYLEILVSKNAEGYSKGVKLGFERFLPLIDNAIEQAKLYCEDSRKLVDELGTSVGRLIEEMRW